MLNNLKRTKVIARLTMSQTRPQSNFVENHNPNGIKRVVVTKKLPGTRWLEVLTAANIRTEICTSPEIILSNSSIKNLIGDKCDGVIGQLTENWGEELFCHLKKSGGTSFSNQAVGYNNVDVKSATKYGISVGNTPGVHLALPCLALSRFALACFALSRLASPCLALPWLALACLALSRLALSCLAFPCLVLPRIALHRIALHCIQMLGRGCARASLPQQSWSHSGQTI
jgi:hypothetical protein